MNIDFSSETDVTCLAKPLISLFDSTAVNLGNDDLTSLCKDIYLPNHQSYRQKSYDNLTKETIFKFKLQSLNYNWKLHRRGRITASNFHEVCHKNVDEEIQKISSSLNTLMLYATTPNVPAITHGQENEKAQTQCKTLSSQEHQKSVIQNTSLPVNAEFTYLGASPDDKGVLQFKCPHNYRYGLRNWQQAKNFCIDENYQIKIDHKYYYQLQGQMITLNMDYCGFFIWAHATFTDYPNYLKIYVQKNDKCMNNMFVKQQN